MSQDIRKIVIVGGGTAGWLTCAVLAAEHCADKDNGIEICLIESPDVKTIGVGEGTWPTMRGTLRKAGIRETDFFRECDASFKQGAKFAKWVTGKDDDAYYHPLVLPQGYNEINLVPFWQPYADKVSFADAVCFQSHICERGLAPKQNTTPEYGHIANYAYHLNAGKFATFLQKHCTEKLGAKHILDHVESINSHENGDIKSLNTRHNGELEGDLFIDCTGFSSLLLGQHFGIPFKSCKSVLFNDTALAVQVPYVHDDDPIASHTISTAQTAGWIWDIGLPTRRGVGHVFSSAHTTVDKAEHELMCYVEGLVGKQRAHQLSARKIDIEPGHREVFWHKNCVAVGLSAGFLEPLEASALVLVELSAAMISEQLPANRAVMDIVAKRFNEKFRYRWDRIIDFLKLHYILTKRTDSDYWIDNCRAETIPEELQMLMQLWRHQPPWHQDFTQVDEVFPSASYQYVLYGMGFESQLPQTPRRSLDANKANQHLKKNQEMVSKLLNGLPTNRELINKIHTYGLQTI